MQLLEVLNDVEHERFNITIKDAMGGSYEILFNNPIYDPENDHSPQRVTTRAIADNASANTVRWAIRDFYGHWAIWGTDVEVEKLTTNDAYETQTEDELITQTVYSVKIVRTIS